jgi:hypothetical protein
MKHPPRKIRKAREPKARALREMGVTLCMDVEREEGN